MARHIADDAPRVRFVDLHHRGEDGADWFAVVAPWSGERDEALVAYGSASATTLEFWIDAEHARLVRRGELDGSLLEVLLEQPGALDLTATHGWTRAVVERALRGVEAAFGVEPPAVIGHLADRNEARFLSTWDRATRLLHEAHTMGVAAASTSCFRGCWAAGYRRTLVSRARLRERQVSLMMLRAGTRPDQVRRSRALDAELRWIEVRFPPPEELVYLLGVLAPFLGRLEP